MTSSCETESSENFPVPHSIYQILLETDTRNRELQDKNGTQSELQVAGFLTQEFDFDEIFRFWHAKLHIHQLPLRKSVA